MLSLKEPDFPEDKREGVKRILKAATTIFDAAMQLKTVARAYLRGSEWFPLAVPLLEEMGRSGKDVIALAKEEGVCKDEGSPPL